MENCCWSAAMRVAAHHAPAHQAKATAPHVTSTGLRRDCTSSTLWKFATHSEGRVPWQPLTMHPKQSKQSKAKEKGQA
eukprot:1160060-Pelagomonas_calceolata.AAC.8